MGSGVLVAGAIALVFHVIKLFNDTTLQAWHEAAEALKLHLVQGHIFQRMRMHGAVSGMQVIVEVTSNDDEQATRYRVLFPTPLGLGLTLRREGFLSAMGRLLGARDIEVGDPEFDSLVLVHGANRKQVRAFLTPARRLRVHRFLEAHGGARITDEGIEVSVNGVERNARALVNMVRSLVDLAVHLAVAMPEDRRFDRAVASRRRGDLQGALRELATAEREAPVVDTEVLAQEGEVLYTMGRHAEAEQVFRRAGKVAGRDPELESWTQAAADAAGRTPPPAQSAGRPKAVPGAATTRQRSRSQPTDAARRGQRPGQTDGAERRGQPSGQSAAAPPAPAAATELTADEVCTALFKGQTSSLDATRVFEERFQGRTVRWTGSLRWVDAATIDLAFGLRPMARAVLEVCQVEPGLSGGRAVQALVRLHDTDVDAMRPLLGQQLTFSGTLAGVDAFARNLYVDEATVEHPVPRDHA